MSDKHTQNPFIGTPADVWLEEQRQLPEQEWLLHEAIAPGALTVVGGRPKAGKSFIAYLMAMALSSGRALGPFKPTGRYPCLYLDLEGVPKKTAQRISLLCKGHKVPESALNNLFMVHGAVPQMLEPGTPERLIGVIKAAHLRVVFLDTFAVNFGGDENSKQNVQAYMDALKRIRLDTGVAIVLVHHVNKAFIAPKDVQTAMDADGGLRGSSAIAGAYDVIFSLQDGWVEGRFFDVMMTRGKYTSEAWMPFELVGEKDEQGEFTSSEVTFGKVREGLGFWSRPPEGRQPAFTRRKKEEDSE